MYRERLPQLDGGLFLTDGGIETTLIFHHGLELPLFAAFDLLKDDEGTEQLRLYYAPYAISARDRGVGLVLESPTWRASPGWAAQLGYSPEQLDALNRKAIALMEELRAEYAASTAPIVISGCVGPEGDGYAPETMLTADEARALPRSPDRDVRRHGGGHGHRDHDDLRRGGDRRHPGRRRGRAAGGDLVHARDRRAPAERPGAGRRDPAGRRRDGRCAGLLHDQLRPPDPLRGRGRRRRAVGAADRRPAHERLHEEPRRAGRGGGARRGRSRRPGRTPRRAEVACSPA